MDNLRPTSSTDARVHDSTPLAKLQREHIRVWGAAPDCGYTTSSFVSCMQGTSCVCPLQSLPCQRVCANGRTRQMGVGPSNSGRLWRFWRFGGLENKNPCTLQLRATCPTEEQLWRGWCPRQAFATKTTYKGEGQGKNDLA